MINSSLPIFRLFPTNVSSYVHTGKENAPQRTANILFLPANCHSYIVTYRIETVNLTKPAGNILVNPAQDSCHFLMDFQQMDSL